MIKNEKWRTATIAEIFVKQGYLNYSKIIYESLLKKEPNNIRLKKGYDKLLDKIGNYDLALSRSSQPSKELIFLFNKWINLILKSKKLNELDGFRKKYKS
ncbi:MAG: hypothetical protein JRJ44_05055 [Deltaproteobacteria bacterium]|nr:hypothetical protein [Deltaproteobacteria bacterium]